MIVIWTNGRGEDDAFTSKRFYLWPRDSGFPGGSERKESACNAADLDLIPGLG